ncbi:TIGR03089 family protein [Halostreptopolyspora alba]|uniref:TIGR03089 family protein n=1 Tax=Halostreptopolyspora alba TaxID=2487137 RepID=UPI0026AFB76D
MSAETPNTPAALWRSALAVDPARPFVTAYDDDTGGRVELSFATFDNWVAKTANMLVDTLATEPGDSVVLALPLHWQSLVWVLASWSAGLTVVPAAEGEVGEGDIVVTDAARLQRAMDTGAREVVGTSLHPLGAPLAECPPAAMDYAVEVRGHGDHFTPAEPPAPERVALRTDRDHSGADLVAAARERASAWGLTSGDRVALLTRAPNTLTALSPRLSHILAPLTSASPVLLTSATDPDTVRSRLDMERATAVVGVPADSPSPTADVRVLP